MQGGYQQLPKGNILLLLFELQSPELTAQIKGGKDGDEDPETNEIHWDYRGRPPISFYSQAISSAERLPNGNTLICEGTPGRIFEVTPSKELVWEYINPFFAPGGAAARGGSGDVANGVFRAHRYGPDHPALQSRDLDPKRYANLNRLMVK